MAVSATDSRPLYPILDVDVAARVGWTLVDLASAYLNGGARFLQLRAKSLSGGAFLDLASEVCDIAHAAGAVLVVNDRADVARLSGADGVHLGQADLTTTAARRTVGRQAIVGLSTHTLADLDAAVEAPVSYIAIGPVFATSTKTTPYAAIGLDRVREGAARTRSCAVDLVAIGGITLDRAADVISAGATRVAVITDLLSTGDPEARVREYVRRLAT